MNHGLGFALKNVRRMLFCQAILFGAMGVIHASSASPPTIPAGSEVQSLSSKGEYFEVVLKFTEVGLGSEAPLTVYILDAVTNEPVKGATVSGGMSDGTETVTVPFLESAHPVVGAYKGKILVERKLIASWLFDISLGEKSDLIAIDGFKTGGKSATLAPAQPSANETSDPGIRLTPLAIVLMLVAFTVLQVAIFQYFRKNSLMANKSRSCDETQ